ncbi:MAG TPA: dynamin family protein [Candidatus Egerieimonas faecigallinarum]|nr:dynamin family protein [Candidatus Egerieimonas faecigallinarum]
MEKYFLEISQMLGEHPIIQEKESYKIKYINILEYFVQKYSNDDVWATSVLHLYIKKLLNNSNYYKYRISDLKKQSKDVTATKFRPFKFFSYRYCLLMDCIFINAYDDRDKGQKIFKEISIIYRKRYHKKLQQLFGFLYDLTVPVNGIGNVDYLKECWNRNRTFFESEPVKVIVTANMSAGKSTLLNALVGKKVNKTQNDACTAKIHYIKNKPFEDSLCYELDYLLDLDADYQTLMEDNKNNSGNLITVGTHFRTLGKDTKRIWFIDTPGVNSSQNEWHKKLAEDTIKTVECDLLIYLLNGENIGTDDDRRHLIFISENYHGNILFVVNKVDRFRKKEDSVQKTIQTVIDELTELGFANPMVVPVSSYAAYLAKMKIFGEPLDEDEQYELERMARKLKKTEYQFDTYYPGDIQNAIQISCDTDEAQLLMHSGALQLEQIIYTTR